MYTDLTVGESCIDQDLWPTSEYHKPWPFTRSRRGEKAWFTDFVLLQQPPFPHCCFTPVYALLLAALRGTLSRALHTRRAEALRFMCSELQVLCIEAHQAQQRWLRQGGGGSATEAAPAKTPALPPLAGEGQNPTERATAATAAKAKPAGFRGGGNGGGDEDLPLLQGLNLTAAQRVTADKVLAALAADFALRRRMLLRRCDVAVQSLLRANRDGADGAVALPPGLKVGWKAFGVRLPYMAVYTTPPVIHFRVDFFQNQSDTNTIMAAFRRSRRDLSIDASLGVCTLPAVGNIDIEIRPTGCVVHCHVRHPAISDRDKRSVVVDVFVFVIIVVVTLAHGHTVNYTR